MALQLILFFVLYTFHLSNAVEENSQRSSSLSIPPKTSSVDQWFEAVDDCRDISLGYLHRKKLITNVDIRNSEGHSALCLLTMSCGTKERFANYNARNMNTFTKLLDLGACPSQTCVSGQVRLPILNWLAHNRCPRVLTQFIHHKKFNGTIINDRLLISGSIVSGFVPIVQFASIRTIHNVRRDASAFDTLGVLLSHPKLDINQRTSKGMSAVKSWCLGFNLDLPHILDSVLKLLWWRPDLDDEQRELILNNCGYNRILHEAQSSRNIWKFSLRKRIEFGSKEFFRYHLEQVLKASKKPNFVNRPMKIVGIKAQDEGGVVASFLEDLSSVAFSVGGHQITSLSNAIISEHVRISVTDTRNELDELEKVFSPAPSSLLLFKDEASDTAGICTKVRESLRTAGVLIGTCLNTLFYSKTLSLGVPLDRIVLQRLIDPTSTIERSDVLDSAIFIKALQMLNWGYSLSEAQEQFHTSWPVIWFDQSSSMSKQTQREKLRKEWEDYSVALVGQLLSEAHSPAFASMLSGFQATIPRGQQTHFFNAAFAHRMLVGETRVTMEMLQPRLTFTPKDINAQCETLFVNILKDLYDEDAKNLNRFLKEVTGSSQLQRSAMSPSITIEWIKNTTDSEFQYCASTCTSTLWLFPTSNEQMMRTILQGVISSSSKYAFNMC